MKILIAGFIALTLSAGSAFAQSAGTSSSAVKKHHRAHTMIKSGTDASDESTDQSGMAPETGAPVSSAGAEVSGVTGAAPGDPYNLAHPYFNGDPRWSDADTLYKHGDFPWAMVSQHPENFNFNASTGQWEMKNASSMGNAKRTR